MPVLFALYIDRIGKDEILELLRSTINGLEGTNCAGKLRIEHFADLGPYFDLLSDQGKKAAREDWLNVNGLRKWMQTKNRIHVVRGRRRERK